MHYRTIALATIVALLAWTLGLPAMVHNADAAAVEFFSDTISDSDFGVDATHTLVFDTVTAMTAGQQFRIYFDEAGTAFDFTSVDDDDLVSVSTVGFTPLSATTDVCGAGTDEILLSVDTTDDFIEGTVCAGDTVPAGTITFVLDGANQINNPAGPADSYVISLQGYGETPIADSGDTRVAIIDDVTVTADVDTIFNFTIAGMATGTAITGEEATIGTSYPTSIPFYTIPVNDALVMAQELSVDTNALNGFSVSVYADQTLTSGNGATIDPFIDASEIASSTLWAGPSNLIGQTDTYGHWGLTSDDTVVSSTTAPGMWGNATARAYVGNFMGASNPVEVFYHNLPVTAVQGGTGVGHTIVAYKVEIGVLQEAAKDYTATLTYIATPVF